MTTKTTKLGPPWWASEETHAKHAAWVAETQRQLHLLAEKTKIVPAKLEWTTSKTVRTAAWAWFVACEREIAR